MDRDANIDMNMDDGFSSFSFPGSPEWTEVELGSVADGSAGSMMGLSAAFIERSEAEMREVTH